jgi:glycosyltransferase involved in cell wall biosynthesis
VRIAFYTPWVPLTHPRTSGDVVIARNLVAALERQGHTVRLMPDFSARAALAHPRDALAIPMSLRRARRIAQAFGPDVWLTCYCDSEAPDMFGPTIAHRIGARYVIYGAVDRGGYRRLRNVKGRVAHLWSGLPGFALNRRALRAADHVIVNKRKDLDGYMGRAWLGPKLSMLSPAISTEDFHRDSGLRIEARRRLGLDEHTVVLLAASRLTYRGRGRKVDSLRFLLDCFADPEIQRHDVTLLIVGDGKARAELEAAARSAGTRTRFLGSIPHQEMNALYNAADVFVFPGLREPIGMVYLEAQACGLPVVAFRNGGIPDVVRDGETAFLVPRMDGPSFKQRLAQLIGDPQLRAQLGAAGIAHVSERHSLDGWGRALGRLIMPEASPAGARPGSP